MPGSSLERLSSNSSPAITGSGGSSRRLVRSLANLEERTLLRQADIQAEGLVAAEKMREVDRLVREAMSGQAMLRQWGEVLSSQNPLTASDTLALGDMARLAKSEIIANLVEKFCREGRR